MSLPKPNLDDRTYADLMEEARRLITSYDPGWTNHNPSDPGITIIELFAHLTEILLYRMNRVTDANQRKFLRLLSGPAWTPSDDLTADTRAVVRRVRERFRAVTPSDYERIATGEFNDLLASMRQAEESGASLEPWWSATGLDPAEAAHQPSEVPPVERARCLSGRNLDRGTEAERAQPDPGHVSLIVVPGEGDPLHPPAPLCDALWSFLDERRILTARHHVVGPSFAPVAADIVVAHTRDATSDGIEARVEQKIEQFLDPRVGGASQRGWPFGRDVYVSELIEQIEAVQGIDYVTDLMLFSVCEDGDDRCVPAPPIWHAEGDLIGLSLVDHHLVAAKIDEVHITSAPSDRFVSARITVHLEDPGAADLPAVKRLVKEGIRAFFHPLTAAPVPADDGYAEFELAALQAALAQLVAPYPTSLWLELDADAGRLSYDNALITGLLVKAEEGEEELVDWRAVIKVFTP